MITLAICDDEPFMQEDIAVRLAACMEEKQLPCQISCFPSGPALLQSEIGRAHV